VGAAGPVVMVPGRLRAGRAESARSNGASARSTTALRAGVDVMDLAEAGNVLPTGPAAAPVVQICHKGPDRAGTPEKNR